MNLNPHYIRHALLFSCLALLVGCPDPHQACKEQIVFLSNRDAAAGSFHIYTMALDNGSAVKASHGTVGIRSISAPMLSPDGTEILYLGTAAAQPALYLLPVRGGHPVLLTELSTDRPQARFSPDGRSIVFCDQVGSHRQIFCMHADGSSRRKLSVDAFDEYDPCFSPNGRSIAFTSKKGEVGRVAVMSVDGALNTCLTDESLDARSPCFSPDSKKIVFSASQEGNSDIYMLDVSRRQAITLWKSRYHDILPSFSPDGRQVLFLSNQRGMRYLDVMIYDLDKQQVRLLTPQLNLLNQNPSFTRDGKRIVFESVSFSQSDIHVMDISGANLLNLTDHPNWDCAPNLGIAMAGTK